MQQAGVLRRGMVLEPRVASLSGERLCVLLDDALSPQVRLRLLQRGEDGSFQLTATEFCVPVSALDALRPVAGLLMEV